MAWNAGAWREQVENASSLVWYGGDKPSVYLCVFSCRCLCTVRRERLHTTIYIHCRLRAREMTKFYHCITNNRVIEKRFSIKKKLLI